GEIVKGPYGNSISNIKGHNLEEVIEVRLGSGLSVIKDSEKFDTITICGMGGPLIASIIKDGVKYLNNRPRFVISSNIYGESVRRQMNDEGYSIVQEEIDRKSTRLNSSHVSISYAVFCLKKKTKNSKSKTSHI